MNPRVRYNNLIHARRTAHETRTELAHPRLEWRALAPDQLGRITCSLCGPAAVMHGAGDVGFDLFREVRLRYVATIRETIAAAPAVIAAFLPSSRGPVGGLCADCVDAIAGPLLDHLDHALRSRAPGEVACACENGTGDCDHGKGDALRRCTRPAGRGRVRWLGPVCDHCCEVYGRYPQGYVTVDASGVDRQ